jgi:DNA polymerase III epsilon subunit-like protein
MPSGHKQTLGTFLEMIRQGDYVILDTETTGLHDAAEVCQIALINHDGATLMDTYVKPRRVIPASATDIHNITNAMVADAPDWTDISPMLVPLLTGRAVIAYNAVFDRKMMHKSAEMCGLPKTDWKGFSHWWCAMLAFSELYGVASGYRRGHYRFQSLKTAARHFNVQVQREHTALDDCLTTLAVVRAMATG